MSKKMAKISFLTTFLLFLTISPPINSSGSASAIPNLDTVKVPAVVIVTDKLIQQICSQTGDPYHCHFLLNQFQGKFLFPKPVANVMEQLKVHSKATSKKIFALYDGIKDPHRSDLKDRYRKCMNYYSNAMSNLVKASKFMVSGKIRFTKHYTTLALDEVRSCDEELAAYRYEPSGLAKDDKKFNDLGGIVLVICNILKTKFMLA